MSCFRRVVRNNSFWDAIVFRKLRNNMGDRIRLMITGSAPVSEEVLTFMRCALGCVVLEGYGQTECAAAATLTFEGDHTPGKCASKSLAPPISLLLSVSGHVGLPIPCCQIKLVDVADMGYSAADGVGEVCIKGFNVFKGYYMEAEKTAEALDADGWLHTGDVGR